MRDYPSMGMERFRKIQADFDEGLTPEHIKAGWHFCADLDGRLVHPSWEEYRMCQCGHRTNGEPVRNPYNLPTRPTP